MTRLLPVQARFEGFSEWLERLPDLPQAKPEVWRALREVSRLPNLAARQAILPDKDPIVLVEDMPFHGRFSPARPRVIAISVAVVEAVESDPTDAQALLHLEATLLHELVHWGLNFQGIPEKDASGAHVEMGNEFEKRAYGGIVLPREVPTHGLEQDERPDLGLLSREFESNGNPGAIGHDGTGGFSYGLYQIASRVGTLGRFLRFLDGRPGLQRFGEALGAAGGEPAGKLGTAEFKRVWKELARDPEFGRAQHAFIKASHYDPFLDRLLPGIDVRGRSAALQDVAWSVSVQHGAGATHLFERPFALLADPADDEAFIHAIYDERSRVDVHFRRSSEKVKQAVRRRFQRERENAIKMLRA